MYEKRRNVIDGVVKSIKQNKYLNVFDALIAKSTAVEQSAFAGVPINHFNPQCQATLTYGEFVDELLDRYKN